MAKIKEILCERYNGDYMSGYYLIICSSFVKAYLGCKKLPEQIKIKIYNKNPKKKGVLKVYENPEYERSIDLNQEQFYVVGHEGSYYAYCRLAKQLEKAIKESETKYCYLIIEKA